MLVKRFSNRTRLAGVTAGVLAATGFDAGFSQTPESTPIAEEGGYMQIAEQLLASINENYSRADGTGLYAPFAPTRPEDPAVAYLWPFSALVSALGARARHLGTSEATADFVDLLEVLDTYFDPESNPPGYDSYPPVYGGGDKFYDDNQWLGLDFIHAYRLTGDQQWLDKSKVIWGFSMSGWTDEDMGGGIYWKEGDFSTKNTCSNGPAAVHAMMLFQETDDQMYLDWAIRIMDWLERLWDPETGVYSDNIDVSGYVEPTKWTYNTGTPMEASAYLYQATGDERWLTKARELAEASLQHFAPVADNQGVRHFPPTPWFNAVLQRGYCALYDADPESDRLYIDALPASLLQAWPACRNDLGLMNPVWSSLMSSDSPLDLLEQAATVEIASVAGLYADPAGN